AALAGHDLAAPAGLHVLEEVDAVFLLVGEDDVVEAVAVEIREAESVVPPEVAKKLELAKPRTRRQGKWKFLGIRRPRIGPDHAFRLINDDVCQCFSQANPCYEFGAIKRRRLVPGTVRLLA